MAILKHLFGNINNENLRSQGEFNPRHISNTFHNHVYLTLLEKCLNLF